MTSVFTGYICGHKHSSAVSFLLSVLFVFPTSTCFWTVQVVFVLSEPSTGTPAEVLGSILPAAITRTFKK